jgi:hypothetical protein
MWRMQATAGSRGAGEEERQSLGRDGRAGAAEAAHEGGAREERFGLREFVCEPQRRRVGRIVAVHRPVPVLYGIKLANGVTSYAYDRDVRAATEAEVTAYDKAVQGWRRIRESHSRSRPSSSARLNDPKEKEVSGS